MIADDLSLQARIKELAAQINAKQQRLAQLQGEMLNTEKETFELTGRFKELEELIKREMPGAGMESVRGK